MKKLLLAFLVVAIYPTIVVAQTTQPVIPVSMEILVIAPNADPATAGSVASRTTPIGATSANCNIATVPAPGPSPLVNPTAYFVNDPFNSGRFCRGDMPVGVPNGIGYQSVAIFVAPSCVISGSTVSPCPSVRSTAGSPLFNIQPVQARPVAPTPPEVRP